MMRPLYALLLSLSLLPLVAASASADLVVETEPNDTIETANKTVGTDNLEFDGSLTLGDVDTLSLFVTPNKEQEAFFAFDVYWSAGSSLPEPEPTDQKHWLVARLPVDDFAVEVGVPYDQATVFFGVYPSPPQIYYLQLYSMMSEPEGITEAPTPGSTVVGNYRLSNLRGFNGSIVTGTAVPEPSAILFAFAFAGSGLWLHRRKKGLTLKQAADIEAQGHRLKTEE